MNKNDKYIKYGKLLPGLIHNLNTPLMGCSGRIELLQMKMGDDKHLNQITTQLDRINDMLKSVAYLLDKDHIDKDTGFDLKVFLENYYNFMSTDMRFKHHIEKELSFEQCNINTNPSALMNYIHTIMHHLLKFIEGASVIQISNTLENSTPCINICMKYDAEIKADFIEPLSNIKQALEKKLSEEIMSRYELHSDVSNEVTVKIIIHQQL